jgi:hypothetical protein
MIFVAVYGILSGVAAISHADPLPNMIFVMTDDQDHLRISSLSITAKCGAISGISSSRATSNSVALRHIRGD